MGRIPAGLLRSLDEANVPTLAMLVGVLEPGQRPAVLAAPMRRPVGMDDLDDGGLTTEAQAAIRWLAFRALERWWAAGCPRVDPPCGETLRRLLSVSVGQEVPPEYEPMLTAELRASFERSRGPAGGSVPSRVAIIGAGLSGIAAARRLGELGIAYTVLERDDGVGGVWRANRYPGAGVDTPGHFYEFSFHPNDWRMYFPLRDEILSYLEDVAHAIGLREHAEFGAAVNRVTFDEDRRSWLIDYQDSHGAHRHHEAEVVVSSVGAFNTPKVPVLPGQERFTGHQFHTAQWPRGLELDGARVAVLGNGASAMQVVPALARTARQLLVVQKAPQWVSPFPRYRVHVPEGVRWLLANVPLYAALYRLRLAWLWNDRLYEALRVDPDWPELPRSASATNARHRNFFLSYLQEKLAGRDDLLAACTPDYPPFGKRILLDNGWFDALRMDHVRLTAQPVVELTTEGVVLAGGEHVPVDAVVYATGFDVVNYLSSFEVRGLGGRTLREAWSRDDAKAYLGSAVPGFPNFFTLYGPNLQPGHGGSITSLIELQVELIVRLLTEMHAAGWPAASVKPEVHEAYNRDIDERNRRMVWGFGAVDNYYRNPRGRVVVNSAMRNVDFWSAVSSAGLHDFAPAPAHLTQSSFHQL